MYKQIKETLSIIDMARKNGIKVSKNNKSLCPFHGDTKTPNLSFKGNIFRCFACDAKGDIFNLVEKIYGITRRESLELIKSQFGFTNITIEYKKVESSYSKEKILTEKLLKLEEMYADTWKYLRQNKPILGEEIQEMILNVSSYLIELEKEINKVETKLYYTRRS
jgi:DNA primase